MILTLAISGFRSLRDIVIPLDQITVITGANGTGKSSFYKALRLLGDVAQGRLVSSLAQEGGVQSTIWAGPEIISRSMKKGYVPIQGGPRKDTVALKLGFASQDYGYCVDLGLPQSGASMFSLDPELKREVVWAGEYLKRSNAFAERRGPVVTVLDDHGNRDVVLKDLSNFDSMMTHGADPKGAPELLNLRERMRGWRFYDHFRTDPTAPVRQGQVGTRTPVLASDGSDLAAAIQTILEIGDGEGFARAIDDAFEASRIEVTSTNAVFEVQMHQHGLLRPLSLGELSDGTLRYILLVAALLTPRPPELLVLNEPETSLHPDLLAPLGRLIKEASQNTQIIVVSHASELVDVLQEGDETEVLHLEKVFGETVIKDLDPPPWSWPKR